MAGTKFQTLVTENGTAENSRESCRNAVILHLYHFDVVCETFYLNKIFWVFAKIFVEVNNSCVHLYINYIHEMKK